MNRAHTMAEVIEARGLIEPAIAAHAAERATPEELAELREVLALQVRKVEAGEQYAEEDARFHDLIGQAARNELLVTMLAAIWDVLRSSREEWLQTHDRAHASVDAHRRILAALEARDVESARTAAADHISEVGQGILQLLATTARGGAGTLRGNRRGSAA